MRRLQCVLFATVAVIGFASIASAADLPVKAPAYAPAPAPYDWTGIYIGGQLGGGGIFANAYETYSGGPAATAAFRPNQTYPMNGPTGGGVIGANYQFGRTVVGIEGEFNWANINGTSDIIHFPAGADTFLTRIDSYDAAKARIGYALGSWNQTLVYVNGGAVWAKVTDSYTFPGAILAPSGAATTTNTFAHTETGWTVGAGVEYALYWGATPTNWLIKAEYKWIELPTQTLVYAPTAQTSQWKEGVSTFQFGVSYKFGGSAPVAAKY
jgi:outer membrane immunogenic protein